MMVSDEEKRWLVVGIAMNKVAAPVIRNYIKQEMDTHYTNSTYCHGLTTPCTMATLTYHHVNADPNLKRLKFQNINNNLHNHGNHKNLYNYNINSSVDLAKLFLPDYLAEFSAFDESLDMSAMLRLLGYNNPAPIFLSPNPLMSIQTSADDVRENVRNKWGHCNVTQWTAVLFNDCFTKLETLVRRLGLTGGVEKTTLDQLSDWKTKGCQLCMGHAVDQNLLSLVQQDVQELIKKFTKTVTEQNAIQESLAQLRTEQTEMQNTVNSIQDQQTSVKGQLEEHDKQLKEVLEWKQQQMIESKEVLEKLVAVEKTISEELLIRVEEVERGLAETDDKVEQLQQDVAKTDDKVEQLQQDVAKTDDKVEQLQQDVAKTDDKVEQLQQDVAKTDDKVEQLQQDVAKTDDKVEQLQQDVAKTDDKVEQLQQDVAKTDDKVEQLQQDVAKTGDKVEQLHQDVAKTDDKVEQLQQDVAKTDDKVEQLQQDVAKTDDKVEQLQQDVAKTDDKVEQLQQDVAKTDDKVEHLEQGFAKTDDKVEQLEQDISETSNKLKELEEDVRSQRIQENKRESAVDAFDVKTCQKKLAEHYQKIAKVPTTVWSSVFQVDLEQIYTRLSWVKKEQTLTGSSQKSLGHYTELFTVKTKTEAAPKRILVQGETGIGKTTFVKKLLVDWLNVVDVKRKEAEGQEGASNTSDDDPMTLHKDDENGASLEEEKTDEKWKDILRRFEVVVSVNLKEVSKCQTLKEVIRCSHLFPEDEEQSVDDLLSYIRKNQDKVLFVLDGYDEYRTGSEAEEKYGSRINSPIYEIFHGNTLRNCTVLLTTRPSRADEIRELADIQAEITGFNMSDREDFMRKMLESQTQVDGLLNFLRKSNMEDLARVPLLNLFFCLLWKQEKEKLMQLTGSKSKLFRAITKHVLQHSHRKHSKGPKLKEEDYEEILIEMGKVALAGLLKGDLVFKYGELPEKVRGEESVIVGLLQVTEYGPSLEPTEMVSFIHKSIQEYLAAWYITYRCVPEGNLGGIEQQAHSLEDCNALENVFQFICGLSDDGAMAVFQHLKSVRSSDPTMDLSKTMPDEENEEDIPLCDVTDQFRRFSWLVYDSFREVRSKAELLSHYFDCTGGIVLVTRKRPLSGLIPKVSIPPKLAQDCVFLFSDISFDNDGGENSEIHKSLELLNCLQMPLIIPESSKVLTVDDLLRDLKGFFFGRLLCFFSSILCFRDGKFQFNITELFLQCDGHVELFTESTADSAAAPAFAANMSSGQSCLKFLRSLRFYNLSSQTVKTLGAVIRNCNHLNSIEAEKCDDSICDLLEQVPNPSKCSLMIGVSDFRRRRDVGVKLTSAGAVQVASLLPRFNNVIVLDLDLTDCCFQAVDKLVTSVTHKTLKRLVLSGMNLTPATAEALGLTLPEMTSLQDLKLIGVDDESILQAEEMDALFGGFNKPLPLSKLTFKGFNVRGCLAPLTKSFHFFPNLTEITLENLNMNEDDKCGLLESFRFVGNLTGLTIRGQQQGQARCYISESNTRGVRKGLNLEGIDLTQATAVALGRSLPEMSSLQELEITGTDGSILQDKETEMLFGGFYKKLPLQKLILNGLTVRGCITPLIKSLRFFPNLRELKLEKIHMDEHDQCRLLESVRSISNLTALSIENKPLGHADDCKSGFTITSSGFPHITSKSLNLSGISLTPGAAAALGHSLPEMLSLHSLSIKAVGERNILQTVDLVALFGSFNKPLPLYSFTFRGFNFRGSIAPLTNSFRFFPNLLELYIDGFRVDEHNLCCLLDSLRFVPRLMEMIVWGEPMSNSEGCATRVNTAGGFEHKSLKELELIGISLTPVSAAELGRLLSGMSALQNLTLEGVHESVLQAEEMELLFGEFKTTLPLQYLTFSDFGVKGCLAPLTKILRFFPNLRNLHLGGFDGEINMNEHNLCNLLESFTFIPNLKTLVVKGKPLSQEHCCTVEVNTTARITHKRLEKLYLDGISLTPAVAALLGRSLPEMSSLQVLELSGVDGSTVKSEEMEALFGGFNNTLPLYKLTFRGFEMTGCLAPLTKSLRFFPNLRELCLGRQLNMDENDVCSLLENLRFMPSLRGLRIRAEHLHQTSCYTTDKYGGSFSHRENDKLNLEGITVTPAVATALGRSLPEMSSLEELEVDGRYESILDAEEMVALFGGFNRAVTLARLTFSGFSVTGCLAPLTKSLCFFPNLRELKLERLNLDEHDQCALLQNFGPWRDLTALRVQGKHRDSFSFHYYTSERRTLFSLTSCEVDKTLHLDGITLTPAVATALGQLFPEMSSLQSMDFVSRKGNILEAETMESLFGGINKTLPVYNVTFRGFSVRGCLAPFTNMLHFVPNLTRLSLEDLDVDEDDFCSLLNAHWQTSEADTVASITHKTLEKLELSGISLTPAVTQGLGRSFPEMSSLVILRLTGVDGSILKSKEMEALFGGFKETLPLSELTFSGFSVRGCLAPLIRSLQFFPSLTYLNLESLNMDEHDLLDLLASFRFVRDLTMLNLSHIPLGHAVRSIVPHVSNLQKLRHLWVDKSGPEQDLIYVRETVKQALPELSTDSFLLQCLLYSI